jgi:hypothetical protein
MRSMVEGRSHVALCHNQSHSCIEVLENIARRDV